MRVSLRPDTASHAISLGLEVGHLGMAQGAEGRATWTGQAAAVIRARQDQWTFTGRWETMRGTGTRFDRAVMAGFDRRNQSGQQAGRLRARWTWKPLPSLTVDVGRDTLHDGWGRRSLFRGGHVAPVPFLQIRLDGGGRLRYRHRVEALRGDRHLACWTGAEGDPRTWVPPSGPLRAGIERMLVAHRLELDLSPRITGALWGGVVWDTNGGERAFEPHYLVPLTSLRPTEYGQGSSDNALVGLEGKIRLGRLTEVERALYGQFLLDELIVSELLGGTQWWGNKFGLLGGVRWDTRWGGWRLEASAARPWTYSHFTRSAAYLHGLTPLAHPLGANFAEATWEGHWNQGNWTVFGRLTASARGDDVRGDSPTGSLPQIGDIDRMADQYVWLNGTRRQRFVAVLDIARTVAALEDAPLEVFFQLAHGRETALSSEVRASEWWAGAGIRATGPFLGADW